jgi:LmbE family N-acetylglucosaminyl deacetylase
MLVDPAHMLHGTVVIVVPHMDDEVLACGGTIARLPDKERIHVIYATDGSQSYVPVMPWRDSVSPDLSLVRMAEARAALQLLGVPENNLYFLDFPDGKLRNCDKEFRESLTALVKGIQPDHVLTPFRYDRHPDHLAANRVTMEALQRCASPADLIEYFVYYRWQLLPGTDVRKYIHPDHLFTIAIETHAAKKRKALDCYKSQITQFYTWQDRPILSQASLDEVCRNPEVFLKYDSSFPDARVFTKARTWIRMVHLIEPILKKRKDRTRALLRRGLGWYGRTTV